MALTESYMLPLGRLAPDFSLLNVVTGKQGTLESLKGSKGTLIIFMCNHCPFNRFTSFKCRIIRIKRY